VAAKPQITILVDGVPLKPAYLSVLRGLEVQQAVHTQAQFHLRFSIGQDATGDWAAFAETTFKPSQSIKIEAKVGDQTVRLINGVLTQLKMNFKADPCESEMELSGFDALELLKRSHPTPARNYEKMSISTAVNAVFRAAHIAPADASKIPDLGASDPQRNVLMQAHDDLEFLRTLATTVNCEVYVEPTASVDQGHFEPLDLDAAQPLPATINVNQGDRTNVRNAQFYYDLSQETVVEADLIDAKGTTTTVQKRLDAKLSDNDKRVLGPPDFQSVKRLERHGREDPKQVERLCEAELDRLAWVVVGKGELDSAAYGDVLIPRHRVVVNGAASAFNGKYLVWNVKHTFTRELYCQTFELRRKLGVTPS
jgi:hypothetical protein